MWWRCMRHTTEQTNRPIAYPRDIVQKLEDVGFEIEDNQVSRLMTTSKLVETLADYLLYLMSR